MLRVPPPLTSDNEDYGVIFMSKAARDGEKTRILLAVTLHTRDTRQPLGKPGRLSLLWI